MTVDRAALREIADWLLEEALRDTPLHEAIPQFAARLHSAGVPVDRCRLTWPMLHPLFEAETLLWKKDGGLSTQRFDRQDADEDEWLRSPVKWMLDRGLLVMRARLQKDAAERTFPLYDELREAGYTDFLALRTQVFGDGSKLRQEGTDSDFGLYVAWGTKEPGGWSQEAAEALQRLQTPLAILCKALAGPNLIYGVANTYLGPTIAREVLGGRITLGSGSQIDALVWYSDLRDSTSLAETMDSDDYLVLLNDYFDCAGRAVVEAGGEILAFVGDAVMAIFPIAEGDFTERSAALFGTLAADNAMALGRTVNARRRAAATPEFRFGIAMGVGKVRLGNIGIRQRLSFSIIGPSANEVERMEKMTKTLQVDVLATETVAAATPERWKAMGQFPLRGFRDAVPLFALRTADEMAAVSTEPLRARAVAR